MRTQSVQIRTPGPWAGWWTVAISAQPVTFEAVDRLEEEHFPVIVANLARMHADGPTLTTDDLGGINCRTLGRATRACTVCCYLASIISVAAVAA